jgi:hypothetical protein
MKDTALRACDTAHHQVGRVRAYVPTPQEALALETSLQLEEVARATL